VNSKKKDSKKTIEALSLDLSASPALPEPFRQDSLLEGKITSRCSSKDVVPLEQPRAF